MPQLTTRSVVVGTGFIGPVHVEALRRLGVTVLGVAAADQEEADEARQTLGVPRSYGSLEEVLADSDVDCVHLAVPNVLHFPMAKAVLKAGKHVVCEKPLAMTSGESAELVALAEASDRVAAVCYNIRFYPLNLQVKEMIAQGELGDIFTVYGSYVQDWLFHKTDYNWRVLAEEGGQLRAVADIGTHWMDLVTSLTGLQIDSVFADLHTVFPVRERTVGEVKTFSGKLSREMETEPVKIKTEDAGFILLRFDSGAKGSLHVSQVTAGRKNCLRYEIAGAKKSLAWNSESPNDLWVGHRDEPNQQWMRDPALLAEAARPYTSFPGGHNEGFPDTFKQLFRAVYEYIESSQGGSVPMFPTFREGHKEVAICEAILQSHQQEKWISVQETMK